MTVESTPDTQGLAFEIYKLIRETSLDTVQDQREIADDAADAELDHGLAEADHLDEQAEAIMNGAMWSGAITIATGATQAYLATTMDTEGPGTVADQARLEMVTSFGKLSGSANDLFQAEGQHYAADAKREGAHGTFEGRVFDRALSEIGAAQDAESGAQDAYELIRDAENESMKTALSRPA
jgi:hypothetical protein